MATSAGSREAPASEEDPSAQDFEADAECSGGEEGTTDYHVPEANKELWKKVGMDNEAGRMLRKLYTGKMQKDAAAKVKYPSLKEGPAWKPEPKAKGSCPQKAKVNVPKPKRERADLDDPKYWKYMFPEGGKKPLEDILVETDDYASKISHNNKPARGRDQEKEKDGLAAVNQFGGGRMMPRGAMGYAEKSSVPAGKAEPRANPKNSSSTKDETGMTQEQREIFEELTSSIAYKQQRLKAIDEKEAKEIMAGCKPTQERTERNKEALQLQNDIDRLLKDLDKLMEITD